MMVYYFNLMYCFLTNKCTRYKTRANFDYVRRAVYKFISVIFLFNAL